MTIAIRCTRPIKQLIERTLGIRILKSLPHGLDVHSDIRRLLPYIPISTVFDVGANIGQSAVPLASTYRHATIHCFEPLQASFSKLTRTIEDNKRIFAHHIALGDDEGSKILVVTEKTTRCRISNSILPGQVIENIRATTLDLFCKQNSIEQIDFLKIDTEGYDLKVLKGAQDLLSKQKILFIQVEAGFGPNNETHASFTKIKEKLEDDGYLIFGFYEQMHEWKAVKPHLRRSDVVFVSPALAILDIK